LAALGETKELALVGAATLFWIFCALLTKSVNLEGMSRRSVVVLSPDLLLDLFNLGRKELNGAATFGTDHVVMGAAIVLMLVSSDAIVKCKFGRKSALGEELESAIDRGESNLRVLLLHQAMEFVGREMVANFEKRPKNSVSLFRVLKTNALEVRMEDALRFEKHFLRNGGLIVNSLRRSWLMQRGPQ